jgi:hypothetical protein
MIAPVQSASWVLHLPFDLKSKNRSAQSNRLSGVILKRRRDTFTDALKYAADRAGLPRYRPTVYPATAAIQRAEWPWPFRRIEIVRLMGKTPKGAWQRPFDDDGLRAGCAAQLRDACQRDRMTKQGKRGGGVRMVHVPGAGLVWDDSAKHAVFIYSQERAPDGKPGVRVTITDEPRSER